MKKLTVAERDRMIAALRYSLSMIESGDFFGLCEGLWEAIFKKKCYYDEAKYIRRWIRKMLRSRSYLEGAVPSGTAHERYALRKPWVEWMIQHLKETT